MTHYHICYWCGVTLRHEAPASCPESEDHEDGLCPICEADFQEMLPLDPRTGRRDKVWQATRDRGTAKDRY